MNFSPKVKSWIILICIVMGTGAAVTVTSAMGGCKIWIAVLTGVGVGATNVYHALSNSPNDAPVAPPAKP